MSRTRHLTRVLGSGFDELSFYTITTLRGWQHRQQYQSDQTEMQLLRELVQSDQAAQVFQQLDTPPLPQVEIQNGKIPLSLRGLARNYRYTHLTFPSVVTTSYPVNDTVHAHHYYRPDHKNAPTLLYLHGWLDFDPAIFARLPLRWISKTGYNLVVMELPHHVHRKSPGTYSGELSLTANLPALLTTVRQAISDIRALTAWLHARGIEHIALTGKSLGGAVAAMTLTVEAAYDCAILFVPAVEPGTSLWRSTYTRTLRGELLRQGIDESATSLMLEALRPGRYKPLLAPERILVIAAAGDRVAFSQDVEGFATNWQVKYATLDWGHLSSHWTGAVVRLVQPFLANWLPDS